MATIAVMIGDPAGIGPEIVVKALTTETPAARVVLVGSADAIKERTAALGAPLRVRPIVTIGEAQFEPGTIDVIDDGTLDLRDAPFGLLSGASGRAVVRWWDTAVRLAMDGYVDAVIKAPVNFEAIEQSGAQARVDSGADRTYLALVAGPLRIVHLTDHIPLREALGEVQRQAIETLIRLTHGALSSWGVPRPRIGVAGLNPHAVGDEERLAIAPAIQALRAEGLDVHGPMPPDSLFWQCAQGEYDCVVAHYHDQGHIAFKTGNLGEGCAIVLGEPFLRVSIPHGTAFDIAGRGVADCSSMLSALRHAAWLGGGRGFPPGS